MSQIPAPEELVVLLDADATPIGEHPKATVHTKDTHYHLAFSCHLFNDKGEVLVTRRALEKRTWPGIWTNSFCGHPAPGEDFHDAIKRRAHDELGTTVRDISLLLPKFSYRAVDDSGIVEHEFCPVYRAHIDSALQPNLAEVCNTRWVSPADLDSSVRATPWAFSQWMVKQVTEIQNYHRL